MDAKQGPPSSVNGWNAEYVDEMFRKWRHDPASVPETWKMFFAGFELGHGSGGIAPSELPSNTDVVCSLEDLQSRVDSLIYHYRDVGHLVARIDPLGRNPERHSLLELEAFGLNEHELEIAFNAQRIPLGRPRMTLGEIIEALRETYCGSIGVEYMDIQNTPERRWLQQRMESCLNKPSFSRDRKMRIASLLRQATSFERFLHTNYVGQKRFSLEGSETLIPLLESVIQKSAEEDICEIVLGMAHRGRLNVLTNILRKSYGEVFSEFEDNYQPGMIMGDGDVKYHKGYSTDWETLCGNSMHLTLTANPSHLEAVDPVVLGRVRAKQQILTDSERRRVMGLLIHGDAAFAGQGVVSEILNLSQLAGYKTGGTIHVIVNNQIGFTTLPADGRSGTYCTDIAKMIQAPIFHVNGDDPEAVCYVAEMAVEYRQQFQKDVVIDMYSYRRLGHNEGDEPSFTQPRMYEIIRNHPTTLEIYTKKLIDEGAATAEELQALADELDASLAQAQEAARSRAVEFRDKPFQREWQKYTHIYSHDPVPTAATREQVEAVARIWGQYPENFSPNPKVDRQLVRRREAILEDKPFDWATGEALAFGTLLIDGTPVRLSGQDSRRGTFSQRHAVVWDVNTAELHLPLNFIDPGAQARFCVYDSPLSEAAVLGFDYGYSLGNPEMLICWEAQFGDFANGAQVIIDQFLASSESKWSRVSGLVMLLPHGYEGQGPEHSSAWLERFLQLCAEDNMQVCNLTTPAQYFHVLRRQMKRNFRKPLILMTPKSLLRHPRAVSSVADVTTGTFREVIDDEAVNPVDVRRLVFCSGKVFYDLLAKREEDHVDDVAVIRLEQFHPFPRTQLESVLKRCPNASEFVWCQEESQNRGGWTFVGPLFRDVFGIDLRYVGRARSASPAVGSLRRHQAEQAEVIRLALQPSIVPVAAVVDK